MNRDEFYELVGEMRAKQKEYFKTRDANILQESKELERKVDKELSDFEDLKYGGKLF